VFLGVGILAYCFGGIMQQDEPSLIIHPKLFVELQTASAP
jgi:hypothetical protein